MTFEDALKEYKRLIEECVCYKEDHSKDHLIDGYYGVHGETYRCYEEEIYKLECLLKNMYYQIN
jgi:hypothetical protein